jgi:hypothetical protein
MTYVARIVTAAAGISLASACVGDEPDAGKRGNIFGALDSGISDASALDSGISDASALDSAISDAGVSDSAARNDASTCNPTAKFGKPTLVSNVNANDDRFGLDLESEGLTMYFSAGALDAGTRSIRRATRSSITGEWTQPASTSIFVSEDRY